ncbi:RNA polymerase sigma factor [Chitinophaga lutea]|uniref:RNA polymerase sigma factor n=1 Tax=Chitinophaga lutea TaxID=2488634 RepID=UPI00131550F8|nr:RNA polymerase sigma-70 factor [Chitinophaga lutea]
MQVIPLYNETALLARVAEGDETAFRRVFDHYWDNVYGVALAFTKSAAIAEEMVQDVFLKIWLKREKLSGVEKFDGYLFMVARNHIFNELRRKVKEEEFTDHLFGYFLETAQTPDAPLLCKELEQMVETAVAGLPPQQRAVYQMSRRQGLSQEEIADSLNISRHTVKSHMNKALQAIRHYMQQRHETEILLVIYFFCRN